MTKYLITLSILLCSCASTQYNHNPKSFPVVIDNSFDKFQIEKIQKALIRWQKKTHINLQIEVKDVSSEKYSWRYDEITTIYNASEGWQRKVYLSYKMPKKVLGITTFPSKDIFLTNTYKIYKTAMHEFGHVLGLDHCYNNWDIMYSKVLPTMSDISWRDIRVARENYREYLKKD